MRRREGGFNDDLDSVIAQVNQEVRDLNIILSQQMDRIAELESELEETEKIIRVVREELEIALLHLKK